MTGHCDISVPAEFRDRSGPGSTHWEKIDERDGEGLMQKNSWMFALPACLLKPLIPLHFSCVESQSSLFILLLSKHHSYTYAHTHKMEIYIYIKTETERHRETEREREEALLMGEASSPHLDISQAPEEEFAKYSEMESHLIVIISTSCHVISESAHRWWFYFFPSKTLQAP